MIDSVFSGDIREISSSVLAYVGDAVFELYVRLHVASSSAAKSGVLHKRAVNYVKAKSQAGAIRVLLPELTTEEALIFRRGKNANPLSMAKNASPSDYKYATGLEAVIGYLYLSNQKDRLNFLIGRILDIESAMENGEVKTHE